MGVVVRGSENNEDWWREDGSEYGYKTGPSILSWDDGGWNGGRERTLNSGYRVDVAGHDEVCGFVDTSNSKFLVREFVSLGIRSGAREQIKDRKILEAAAVVSFREGWDEHAQRGANRRDGGRRGRDAEKEGSWSLPSLPPQRGQIDGCGYEVTRDYLVRIISFATYRQKRSPATLGGLQATHEASPITNVGQHEKSCNNCQFVVDSPLIDWG